MTASNLIQRFLSSLLAIGLFTSNYQIEFSRMMEMEKLMDKAIDFSSLSFGFLLAVLALLLQITSPAMQRIIESNRFEELINLNKKAVIASAILSILALLYIALKLQDAKGLSFFIE